MPKLNRTGYTKHPAYARWYFIKRACTEPRDKRYANYGGKGIRLCERWLDFNNFIEDMGEPPEYSFLSRIDKKSDYTPENCIWECRTKMKPSSNRVLEPLRNN